MQQVTHNSCQPITNLLRRYRHAPRLVYLAKLIIGASRNLTTIFRCVLFATVILGTSSASADSAAKAGVPTPVDHSVTEYLQGIQFEHGEGEAKDYLRAASLFCSSARAGNRDAIYELGWMYANGRGVPADESFARGLFERAERLGHQHAKALLSVLPITVTSDLPPCLTVVAATELPNPSERSEGRSRDLQNLSGAKIYRLVTRLAPQYKIDPNFALAIIYIESGFNVHAVSPKNAQGLMQLIPDTAKRFNVKNPFDAEQNIAGGMAYLRWLLTFFKGDVRLVSAAYNAGEGTIQHYRGVPPFPETRRYVERITSIYGRTTHPFETSPNSAVSSLVKNKTAN